MGQAEIGLNDHQENAPHFTKVDQNIYRLLKFDSLDCWIFLASYQVVFYKRLTCGIHVSDCNF